jgi:shikimate dehydrogenase
MMEGKLTGYKVFLNPKTRFLLSTSASQTSIEKHNRALQEMGINFVYFSLDRPITSQEYVGLFRSPIVRGGAVTGGSGLKSGVIPFLDKVDKLAKRLDAVNTVVNRDGVLYGYNTDAFGFRIAIKSHIKASGLKIKKVAVYGNGGVAGVAAHGLRDLGLQVTMIGRNPKHVKDKMRKLKLSHFDGPYDLLVNATPISPNPLPKAINLLDALEGVKMVFDHDMPEKDGKKNYLEAHCKKNKIYFAPGRSMYVPQMIKQWRLFLDGYVDDNGKKWKVTEADIKKHWKVK